MTAIELMKKVVTALSAFGLAEDPNYVGLLSVRSFNKPEKIGVPYRDTDRSVGDASVGEIDATPIPNPDAIKLILGTCEEVLSSTAINKNDTLTLVLLVVDLLKSRLAFLNDPDMGVSSIMQSISPLMINYYDGCAETNSVNSLVRPLVKEYEHIEGSVDCLLQQMILTNKPTKDIVKMPIEILGLSRYHSEPLYKLLYACREWQGSQCLSKSSKHLIDDNISPLNDLIDMGILNNFDMVTFKSSDMIIVSSPLHILQKPSLKYILKYLGDLDAIYTGCRLKKSVPSHVKFLLNTQDDLLKELAVLDLSLHPWFVADMEYRKAIAVASSLGKESPSEKAADCDERTSKVLDSLLKNLNDLGLTDLKERPIFRNPKLRYRAISLGLVTKNSLYNPRDKICSSMPPLILSEQGRSLMSYRILRD